jgi:dienelactone hydrolase
MKRSMTSRRWPNLWLAAALVAAVGCACAAEGLSTEAGPDGPAQTAYAPQKVPAPVVVVISGQSGPTSYQSFAAALADLGYYTVLVAGRDILNPGKDGPVNLRKAITRAQQSPQAVPGKVAVIGFSLGGGGALAHAAGWPDRVSTVVAYYPFTSFRAGPASLVKNFRVPVLLLAAELDRYNNCCLIESAQAIAATAKDDGLPFELVVYPQANHGFNLQTGAAGEPVKAYRADDSADAWRRTVEMLRQHQPLK